MKKLINISILLFLFNSCTVKYPVIEKGNYQDKNEKTIRIQKGKGCKSSTYYLSDNTINGVLYPVLKVYSDSVAVLSSIYQSSDIKCFVVIQDERIIIYNDTLFIELKKIKDESTKKYKREVILDDSEINH